MVNGDIPPLLCAFGSLGPRGPCCIPLSTSSKPIVLSSRVPSPTEKITARYDGYKARAARAGRGEETSRRAHSSVATIAIERESLLSNLKDLKRGRSDLEQT